MSDAMLAGHYSSSSIHWLISEAEIWRLGKYGFKVPAVTFHSSEDFAFANCLASIPVVNPLLCLEERARYDVGRHWLGVSNDT